VEARIAGAALLERWSLYGAELAARDEERAAMMVAETRLLRGSRLTSTNKMQWAKSCDIEMMSEITRAA
jgi:hypothetical protein